jgi:hypothetical protein
MLAGFVAGLVSEMDSAGREESPQGLKPGLSDNLKSELKLRPPINYL